MRLLDMFRKNKANNDMSEYPYCEHEYCTYCYAALPLQKGYRNDLPYWICKGCGGMLINPEVPDDSSVSWICDECEAMLNIQPGFSDTCGNWQCTECGYINKIDKSEIYASDDEYRAAKNSPYKGLDEQILLDIMKYQELRTINDREDILLVQDEGKLYVKKILKTYDISVYKYLMEYPILHMPRIEAIYEGNKSLIVIEEYIQGRSLEDIIGDGPIEPSRAVELIRQLCYILEDLHKQKTPIIHRDIKPSNIIITDAGELYLLDINVAKWYKTEEKEDTKLLGTRYYAAPEQFGYGLKASSPQTDIYSVGILLNELVTGKIPKDEQATGDIWNIVSKCIALEPKDRYTDSELIDSLNNILVKN